MNRYCYILMLLGLIISPCFAMLDPRAFGQFQRSSEQPASEPEFPSGSIYGMNVVTGESSEEPSDYPSEQPTESLVPEEFTEELFEQQVSSEQQAAEENTGAPQTFVQPPTPSASQTPVQPLVSTPTQPSAPIAVQPAPVQQSPAPISPAQPVQTGQPAPAAPTAPVAQPPAKPTTPGKAYENITKANSRLSSALRRLDAIKGYYKEISQEDRRVIKTKAENVLKEYQKGISSFAHRIGQVKNELGARVDKDKLAPFNTFIDLVNKLSQGIKRL